jgi:hypothetical protein
MKPEEARIFLSYAHMDEKPVRELYQRLKNAGFYPWMDKEDILPGEDWELVIKQTIKDAPFFLACLSHNSINHRGVVQEEIRSALETWRRKLDSDIYLIPIKLEDCPVPAALAKFNWVELYKEGEYERLCMAIKVGLERLNVIQPIHLRSEPNDNLTEEEIKAMLQANDFYHVEWYWMGRGVQHKYELKNINGDRVVIDYTTNLMWQQSGSAKKVFLRKAAQKYIAKLNTYKFAGFNDWRLPTLEEAMSLMEPKKNEDTGLYINSLFDKKQDWIWTIDKAVASGAWGVDFIIGVCNYGGVGDYNVCIRAVRSV